MSHIEKLIKYMIKKKNHNFYITLITESLGQVDIVETRSHTKKMESDLSKSINR